MSSLRAALRVLGLIVISLAIYVPYLLCRLLASAIGPSALGRAAGAGRDAIGRGWSRGCLAIIGVRIEVNGRPPRPPFFLVSNHVSYVDILTLGALVDGVFVAKSEVASWPLIGWMARLAHTIFVDRSRKSGVRASLAAIDRVLDQNRGLVLFPEGTSGDGTSVLPFRSSLLQPAAHRRWPVHTATLAYRTRPGAPPARTAVCWWGDMTLWPHLWALLKLDGFLATVSFGAEAITEPNRHQLATRLQHAVASRIDPAPTLETAWTACRT